ncbi:MAG: L-threonylcarbamoyladenylate synthase [Polyangiaceae bacterium]
MAGRPHILVVDRFRPEAAALRDAASVLRRGSLVAFPTETVYGLGARALDESAIARVYAAKGRPVHNPLIAHVLDAAHARELAARWPEDAARLAAAFWPGPLTLVVDRAPRVPGALAGGGSSVAVRAPSHAVARALIEALGEPVAAPSANRYQGVSPTLASHVVKELGDAVDLVLDAGPCDAGIESTVVDVRGAVARVLRPGALDVPSLREVVPGIQVPRVAAGAAEASAPVPRGSPGLDARHYSPRTPLELTTGAGASRARAAALAASGARVGLVCLGSPPGPGAPAGPALPAGVLLRELPAVPAAYAEALYRTLHDLDESGLDRIVVEDVPRDSEAWLALADRLTKASAGSP